MGNNETMVSDVVESLSGSLEELQAHNGKIAELEEKLASDLYMPDAMQGFKEELARLKREVAKMPEEAREKAEAIIDARIKELREADMPKASEITEDAMLLDSGIKLHPNEVVALAKKPENQNPTMQRIVRQYADGHKIELPVENRNWYGNRDLILEAGRTMRP